jgi:hypothetical protein
VAKTKFRANKGYWRIEPPEVWPAPEKLTSQTLGGTLRRLSGSEAFWQGFAGGWAPEHHLLQRWECPRHLVNDDTIRYSWDSVGKSLNEALVIWGSVFDDETGTESDADAADHGSGESATNAAGWFDSDHAD